MSAPCLWCARAFAPRRDGGRPQRFCREACRRAFDAAARAYVAHALETGALTRAALQTTPTSNAALVLCGNSGEPVPYTRAADLRATRDARAPAHSPLASPTPLDGILPVVITGVNVHRRLRSDTVDLTLRLGAGAHRLAVSLAYDAAGVLREVAFVGRGKIGHGLDLLLHDLGIQLSRAIQHRHPDTGRPLPERPRPALAPPL